MSEVDLQLAARDLNRRLGSTDENAEKTILDTLRILTLKSEIEERKACALEADKFTWASVAASAIRERGSR